jgi:predicted lipid-binding transport protein (Tim44 family)
MSHRFSRFLAIFMLVASTGALLMTSFDAEARRMGGGKSFGRQSSNITQQRQAVTPPAARSAPSAAAAAPAAGAAGATAARSGMSKWLGPVAGIAAGLGIAALLSHLGLSGAFLEMMSSLVLIGLVVFAVIFLVRKLRDSGAGGAMRKQAAAGPGPERAPQAPETTQRNMWRQSGPAAAPASVAARPAAAAPVPAAPVDEKWFIPADFDTSAFLGNAKSQFIAIQGLWDSGDLEKLHDYLTDDLVAEIKPQMLERDGTTQTEVVLLNAELLGIEKVSDGHLASVRYSGMLREAKNTEAFRFEEVWNLYKAEDAGWLLAGIQQIPVEYEG